MSVWPSWCVCTMTNIPGLTCNTRSRETPSKSTTGWREDEEREEKLIGRSYVEDFRAQHFQYESHREIFMAAPTAATDTGVISLRELIDFISHVADCYPDITKDFPQQLIDMLMQHHLVLEPELREKIVGSLVLLRKKDRLDSATYVFLCVCEKAKKRLTGIGCCKHYSRSSFRRPVRPCGRFCSRRS